MASSSRKKSQDGEIRPVTLIRDAAVKLHMKSCKKAKCGLCAWGAASWRTPDTKPWLKLALNASRHVRAGCSVCCKARTGGVWSRFDQNPRAIKWQHVRKHADSLTHQQALQSRTCRKSVVAAPPAGEFEEALHNMAKGGSCREMTRGCTSDKAIRMRWALSEAILDESRSFLRDASTICLLRDERKGRLLIRFKASKKDLSQCSGVVGFEAAAEGNAETIGRATMAACERLCTPWYCPPRFTSENKDVRLDKQCLQQIRKATTILVTDAAANELLASQQLRGRRELADGSSKGGSAELPNVRLVGRDAAHAATRLLKKPFHAHPVIDDLLQRWVSGSDSFSQRLHHSSLYSAWFRDFVSKRRSNADELAPLSVCAAKHRFASLVKPLSTICQNLPAVLQLCHKVAAMRNEEDSAWARRLMRHVGARDLLLLGMTADCATTVKEFVRVLDQEETDIARLNEECAMLLHRIRALFLDGQVLQLPTFARTPFLS